MLLRCLWPFGNNLRSREFVQFLQRAVKYIQIHIGINTIDPSLFTVLPERPFKPAARQRGFHSRDILIWILCEPERMIFCPGWRSPTCFRQIVLQEKFSGIDNRLFIEGRFHTVEPCLCGRNDLVSSLTILGLEVEHWG